MPAELVGRRVVIRRHAGERDGRRLYSDVLGHLVEAGPDTLVVRRADGSRVSVPRAEVHRLKPVPERRVTTRDILAVEEVSARGWPAPETEWLGRWLLRAGGGVTGRANSVLPLGDPGVALPEALRHVRAWYAERHLPTRIQVPLPARAALDAELAARGWQTERAALVLTGGVGTALDLLPERPDLPAVARAPDPPADWLESFRRYRGLDALPPETIATLTGSRLAVFASYVEDGLTVAIGRGAVDEDWLGVTALDVRPERRRRGVARHVLRALLRWAAGHGATRLYLQVGAGNEPALALYGALAVTEHHRYHYRVTDLTRS